MTLDCPPTASQERLIMEGVSGSRQFFDMNSRGGRKLLRAGSTSNILLALSATFPPLSSSIRCTIFINILLCCFCVIVFGRLG